MLPMETALQTLDYLDRELDYFARSAALNQLARLQTVLKKTSVYGSFKVTLMEYPTVTKISHSIR